MLKSTTRRLEERFWGGRARLSSWLFLLLRCRMSLNLPKDLYGVTSPPTINDCPQSSSHLSGNSVCSILGSVYWTSSPRAVLLACTPMRISPSLYMSALKRIRSRSWLCDFLVIPSARHSWALFIRLSLTVPLLQSCCISYSIDALTRYSAYELICFLNRFFIFGTCLFWSDTCLLLPLSGNSVISVDIFLVTP